MRRALWVLAALAAAEVVAERPAFGADDVKKACIEAYEDAQTQKLDGKPRGSRRALLACMRPACPDALANECAKWLGELEASAPTVILSARDAEGKALVDVAVDDGADHLTLHLDGAPIVLDPGEHRLRFSRGGVSADVAVTLRAGDRGVHVEAVILAPPAPPPPRAAPPAADVDDGPRPMPTEAIVFGVAGAASLGAFAVFGLLGLHGRSELEASACKPNCSIDQAHTIQREFLAADVALTTGIVSVAIATVLFATRPHVHEHPQAAFGLTPLPSGGLATFGASF